jgi:hypothetical protein
MRFGRVAYLEYFGKVQEEEELLTFKLLDTSLLRIQVLPLNSDIFCLVSMVP